MKVMYKRELVMQDGSKADFILGKVYEVDEDHGYEPCIENEQGTPHYMDKDFMYLHFDEVRTGKKMTIDVAHRLVAFDTDIACMQAELDNLRERIAERMEQYQALKDEYDVEE